MCFLTAAQVVLDVYVGFLNLLEAQWKIPFINIS